MSKGYIVPDVNTFPPPPEPNPAPTPRTVEQVAQECAEYQLGFGTTKVECLTVDEAALIIAATMREVVKCELAAKDAEIADLKSKADECWGAANYRLKYLACLFRALGRPDDETIESNVSAAAEQIRELITSAEKAEAELAEARLYQQNNYEGLKAAWAERDQLRAALAVAEEAGNEMCRIINVNTADTTKWPTDDELNAATVAWAQALARIAAART